MSTVWVNDLFDDLKNENQRLTQLVSVLFELKEFCHSIITRLDQNLDIWTLLLSAADRETYLSLRLKCDQLDNRTDADTAADASAVTDTTSHINAAKAVQSVANAGDDLKLIQISDSDDDRTDDILKSFTEAANGCPMPSDSSLTADPNLQLILSSHPFACLHEQCGQRFTTKYHLIRHQVVHSSAKPFRCSFPKCRAKFKRLDHLKNHMLRKGHHYGREHVPLVQSTPPPTHECDICGEQLATSWSLSEHKLQTHRIVTWNQSQSQLSTAPLPSATSSFEFSSTLLLANKFGVKPPTPKKYPSIAAKTKRWLNHPPRPYALFLKDMSAKIRYTNCDMTSFHKTCSAAWKCLSITEKAKYSRKAAEISHNKRINPELGLRPSLSQLSPKQIKLKTIRIKDPSNKRSPGSYWAFANRVRAEVSRQMQEQADREGRTRPNGRDINVEIGNRWRLLTQEEKDSYRTSEQTVAAPPPLEDDDEVMIIEDEEESDTKPIQTPIQI